jgi:hypothetical protein
MLNTYIKNKGITQTIIHNSNNNQNEFNEINWDADYDGNTANISVTTDTNGLRQHYDATLDNIDLDKLLNIPSVDMPLHKRLADDFANQMVSRDPRKYYIELPETEPENMASFDSIQQDSIKPRSYISSPMANEEIIVPITIDDRKRKHHKYTLTAKKHHIRKKTHNTYRAYKRHKSSTKSAKIRRSKSRSNAKRASSKPFSIF